jgi:hypothetical protein
LEQVFPDDKTFYHCPVCDQDYKIEVQKPLQSHTIWELFHRLWTRAADTPGYRKMEWIALGNKLSLVLGSSFAPPKQTMPDERSELHKHLDQQIAMSAIFVEIQTRRAKQDTKHGGPAHDDTLTIADWYVLIYKYIHAAHGLAGYDRMGAARDALVDAAALAVAAIESLDRRNTAASKTPGGST